MGYQTNTMVYGIGGYRVRDYVRLGLPVTLTAATGIVLLIHIVGRIHLNPTLGL